MRAWPGQITRLGFGVPAIVWKIKPYVVSAFFSVKTRAQALFQVGID
jgi:hypothetical protein